MGMKKKFVKLLSGTLALTMLLGACGDKDTSSAGSAASATTQGTGLTADISVWVLEEKRELAEYVKEEFKKIEPGVNVEIVTAAVDVHKQNLKVGASSKSLPTIWFNWGGNLGSFYAENGLTYDLTEYAKEHDWDSIFQKSALELCTYDGELAGYPFSLNMMGMFYRKDIFEENGIEVPETFEEFEQVCADLKAAGITPISTAGKYGWHPMRILEQFVEYYAGPEEHDGLQLMDASWGPDNEAVNKAFEKYQEFSEKGYFPTGFVTEDPNDAKMLLYAGNAAMQLEGQWFDGKIIDDEQDIDLYGYFPFPSSDTAGEGRMSAFAEMYQINANVTEEELEAAMAFLDCYTSPEVVEAKAEFFNLPLPKVGATIPSQLVNVETMVSDMDKRGIFTITDQAFPPEVADVLFAAQDAIVTGTMDPDEAGASVQAGIDKYKKSNA